MGRITLNIFTRMLLAGTANANIDPVSLLAYQAMADYLVRRSN